MTKHEAIAKIREVIGPEVCPAISAARVAMEDAGCDPELIAALEASTATTWRSATTTAWPFISPICMIPFLPIISTRAS